MMKITVKNMLNIFVYYLMEDVIKLSAYSSIICHLCLFTCGFPALLYMYILGTVYKGHFFLRFILEKESVQGCGGGAERKNRKQPSC